MNMNDATQFLIEPAPGFVGSYDRIAAYRLRSAAFQRHLIRDRFEQRYGTPVSAVAAKQMETASRDFAPTDHPLLYRTAGITDLVADVSKLVSQASRFVADVARETFALWRRSQATQAMSKLWN